LQDSIEDLSYLEVLDLAGNQLNGEIPATINTISSLQELYLQDNNMTGAIPNLSGLVNLTHLNLSSNGFV
jgi:Leucine-rich repeat (LRR) protein